MGSGQLPGHELNGLHIFGQILDFFHGGGAEGLTFAFRHFVHQNFGKAGRFGAVNFAFGNVGQNAFDCITAFFNRRFGTVEHFDGFVVNGVTGGNSVIFFCVGTVFVLPAAVFKLVVFFINIFVALFIQPVGTAEQPVVVHILNNVLFFEDVFRVFFLFLNLGSVFRSDVAFAAFLFFQLLFALFLELAFFRSDDAALVFNAQIVQFLGNGHSLESFGFLFGVLRKIDSFLRFGRCRRLCLRSRCVGIAGRGRGCSFIYSDYCHIITLIVYLFLQV